MVIALLNRLLPLTTCKMEGGEPGSRTRVNETQFYAADFWNYTAPHLIVEPIWWLPVRLESTSLVHDLIKKASDSQNAQASKSGRYGRWLQCLCNCLYYQVDGPHLCVTKGNVISTQRPKFLTSHTQTPMTWQSETSDANVHSKKGIAELFIHVLRS